MKGMCCRKYSQNDKYPAAKKIQKNPCNAYNIAGVLLIEQSQNYYCVF